MNKQQCIISELETRDASISFLDSRIIQTERKLLEVAGGSLEAIVPPETIMDIEYAYQREILMYKYMRNLI